MTLEIIGILSILEGDLAEESKRLWALFENSYGSRGVQSFDYPNVTFQGGECSDLAAAQKALATLSHNVSPFDLTVNGLDYFANDSKVIFLRVPLSDELRNVNQIVNDRLTRCCETVFDDYRPEKWRPHITVAMGDLTEDNFARAWHDLRDYQPCYRQTISNLCLVRLNKTAQHIEIVHREALS